MENREEMNSREETRLKKGEKKRNLIPFTNKTVILGWAR
jgi:hypothetical protein